MSCGHVDFETFPGRVEELPAMAGFNGTIQCVSEFNGTFVNFWE